MQQTCLAIELTGYVVIVNEILVCEYVSECNVAPPGVHKLSKQAVDFFFDMVCLFVHGVLRVCQAFH